MTQDALATAMGVHRTRVAQLESGYGWTLAQADDAARALGCDVCELLGGIAPSDNEWAIIRAMRQGDVLKAINMLTAPTRGR